MGRPLAAEFEERGRVAADQAVQEELAQIVKVRFRGAEETLKKIRDSENSLCYKIVF